MAGFYSNLEELQGLTSAVIASMVTAVQDTYEASITKFSVTDIPTGDALTIAEFFDHGGVFSPEMLLSIFHMTVIVCTAILLIAVVNSIPRLKISGARQFGVLVLAAVLGTGGILAFAAVSEIDSRLTADTKPTTRLRPENSVQAWTWALRQHDIPGKPATADPRQTFIDYCSSCHGETARGVKDQGANLVTSTFTKRLSDLELIDFIMMGRQPNDPDSQMKLLMPAFDYLTEEELAAVVTFIRAAK